MEPTEKKEADQQADMIVKYGKTVYRLFFRFAEKGKMTMNDKALKLIRTTSFSETNIVQLN